MGNGVANQNTFIGGAAATDDFRIYLATTALGGSALSGGATGLIIENGGATGTSANKLINTNATFTSALVGKTVYNTTDGTWAKIDAVDSTTQLSLSADIMTSGETYDIADAVDDLEDAYSVVPNPYSVNVTITASPGTFTYAGAVTLGGKSASGAVVLTLQGATTTTTIESTTTTTLTFGDIITVDDITFSDSIIFSSNVITSDCAYVTNLTTNGTLTGTNLTITGNLVTVGVAELTTSSVGGNLTSTNAITLNTTNVTGNVIANGAFTNTVSITVGGTFTVYGTCTLATATITGHTISYATISNTTSLSITGNFTTNGVAALVDLDVGGNLTINAEFDCTTDLDVTGDITTNAKATVAGSITCANITTGGGALTQTGTLTVTTDALFNGEVVIQDIAVGGNLTSNSKFTESTDLDVVGNATFNGETTLDGTLTVGGTLTAGGSLVQTGTLSVTINAIFNGVSSVTDLDVGGYLESSAKFTSVTDLDVTGATTFNGQTSIAGGITSGGDFTVGGAGSLTQTGTLSITTNALFNGDATVQDVDIGGTLTSNAKFTASTDLDVTGNTTFNGETTIDGTITCGGNFTLNGTLAQTGSLVITGTLDTFGTADMDDITVGGDADFGATLRLTGINVFNGNVYARGRFEVVTTTFNKNVYAEFGCDGVWDTCTITSPFKLYIQSSSTANRIISSTLTIANDPTGIINISSTITIGYTYYVATPALGGDDATATGLELFSSTTTGTTVNKLVDTGASFTEAEHLGKTVYNSTDDTWAEITAVDSATQLSLDADIMVSGDAYKVVDAFSTIGGAVDAIPGAVNCDTTIKVSNGTFAEHVVVQGKNQTGNFFIEIQGSMTPTVTLRNVTATTYKTATVDGAALTASAHIGQLLRVISGTGSTNRQEAIVLSNTTNQLTIVGSWLYSTSYLQTGVYNGGTDIDTTTDVAVYDFATLAKSIRITGGQKGVRVYHMNLYEPSTASTVTGGFQVDSQSFGEIYASKISTGTADGRMIYVDGTSIANILGTKWEATTTTYICQIQNGSVIQHYNSWGNRRMAVAEQCVIQFWASVINGLPININGIRLSNGSNASFGFDTHSASIINSASGTGYDLNLAAGSGAVRGTSAANTITKRIADATTFCWIS